MYLTPSSAGSSVPADSAAEEGIHICVVIVERLTEDPGRRTYARDGARLCAAHPAQVRKSTSWHQPQWHLPHSWGRVSPRAGLERPSTDYYRGRVGHLHLNEIQDMAITAGAPGSGEAESGIASAGQLSWPSDSAVPRRAPHRRNFSPRCTIPVDVQESSVEQGA